MNGDGAAGSKAGGGDVEEHTECLLGGPAVRGEGSGISERLIEALPLVVVVSFLLLTSKEGKATGSRSNTPRPGSLWKPDVEGHP